MTSHWIWDWDTPLTSLTTDAAPCSSLGSQLEGAVAQPSGRPDDARVSTEGIISKGVLTPHMNMSLPPATPTVLSPMRVSVAGLMGGACGRRDSGVRDSASKRRTGCAQRARRQHVLVSREVCMAVCSHVRGHGCAGGGPPQPIGSMTDVNDGLMVRHSPSRTLNPFTHHPSHPSPLTHRPLPPPPHAHP